MGLLQVAKDVPAAVTGETIKILFFFVDRKRRGGILVKGTVPHQVFPLLFELDVLANDVGNVHLVA